MLPNPNVFDFFAFVVEGNYGVHYISSSFGTLPWWALHLWGSHFGDYYACKAPWGRYWGERLLYSLIQGSPFKAIPIVSTLCLKGSTPFVALASTLGSLSLHQIQEAYKSERPPWVNTLPNTLNMAPINNMCLPSSQSLEKAFGYVMLPIHFILMFVYIPPSINLQCHPTWSTTPHTNLIFLFVSVHQWTSIEPMHLTPKFALI
jgi:hypothetical protein